jgi:hypothetical protein
MPGVRSKPAEKLIRVLLIHHGIEPGLDHHLDILVAKLPEHEPWRASLAPLHKYTPSRPRIAMRPPVAESLRLPRRIVSQPMLPISLRCIADARSQLVSN